MNHKDELERGLEGKLLLPARELARLVGVDVSTLRRWSRDGHVPAPVKISGRVLWQTAVLSEWLEQGCPHRSAFIQRPTIPLKKAAQ